MGENPAFAYPGLAKDRLCKSDYLHRGAPHKDCSACDSTGLARLPSSEARGPSRFIVHDGSIASGNSIIEDAKMRDEFRRHYQGLLCYEMEAAAVAYQLRPLVIRGITSYCDSHRSNRYINYAAALAAAVARQVLYYKKAHVINMPMSCEWKETGARLKNSYLLGYQNPESSHSDVPPVSSRNPWPTI